MYDYLIVGAGLYGATFAHLARKAGRKCLVIDRRNHLGGNTYMEEVEGIRVHTYGAHIFHTSDAEVWDFVNSIVPFRPYINSPVADYKGRRYNLPFNMNTFSQMWGVTTADEARAVIEEQRADVARALAGREPQNLEEQALMLVGRDIYETLVKGYTEKQWGRPCNELPAFIIRRLPVRFIYDNNYFNDTWQGIPEGGYNRLVEGLLSGIETRTGIDYLQERAALRPLARKVLFTGAVDAYFDYRFGPLEYRSVRFEQEILDRTDFQGTAVVNYTDRAVPWTRVIEHKHFEPGLEVPRTVISREYSVGWSPGIEPYYPVNDARNAALYGRYRALADAEPDVVFGGRLAEYRYYDMAPVIRKVLDIKEF
ncbi:MAG: UDP-galactopyranose mutase [Bacteroidales bacterium]|nr:UDP-galactopyranose mutase [Bacteroidales bacterium]